MQPPIPLVGREGQEVQVLGRAVHRHRADQLGQDCHRRAALSYAHRPPVSGQLRAAGQAHSQASVPGDGAHVPRALQGAPAPQAERLRQQHLLSPVLVQQDVQSNRREGPGDHGRAE